MNLYSEVHEFKPPSACDTCPEQINIASEVNRLQIVKLLAEYAANGLVGEEGEKIDQVIRDHFDNDEIASVVASELRKETGNTLDEIDESIQELKERSEALFRSCDKPLKMRAEKAGREYKVALCTSALTHLVNMEAPEHANVHVWVRTDKPSGK